MNRSDARPQAVIAQVWQIRRTLQPVGSVNTPAATHSNSFRAPEVQACLAYAFRRRNINVPGCQLGAFPCRVGWRGLLCQSAWQQSVPCSPAVVGTVLPSARRQPRCWFDVASIPPRKHRPDLRRSPAAVGRPGPGRELRTFRIGLHIALSLTWSLHTRYGGSPRRPCCGSPGLTPTTRCHAAIAHRHRGQQLHRVYPRDES